MSDDELREKLDDLIETWRETAQVGNEMGDNIYAAGLRGCANELESVVEEQTD